MLLRQSWVTIIAEMREGTMPRGYFLCPGPHYSCKEHSQKVIRFKIPPERLDFGVFPRKYYPLVIFLLTESDEGAQIDDTLALISIIHIEDQECTLPTSVLAQYMKQYSGMHFCLKLLYVVTGFNDGEVREEEELLCVVCQFFPLSRVLLPCRHACICALCFSRINTCPMCRAQISSYFCVRNENYILRENKGIGRSAVDELAHWMFRNLRM
uniref:RING-type domain-containing protein n=2 Tax=Rhodnius TaxID=13248 RepID=T1HKF0_RHOPR